MSYIRADEILPKELLETIQQYVDGQIIYIPKKIPFNIFITRARPG